MSTTDARDHDGLEPAAAGKRGDSSGASGSPETGAPGAMKAKQCKGFVGTPRLPRLQLDTLARVRREMAQLYVEAKCGRRDVGDTSKLCNVLALIGRIIENGELERRLTELEKLAAGRP